MMSVKDYALDVGRSVKEILDKCNTLGFSASNEDDILSEDEVIDLDNAVYEDNEEENLIDKAEEIVSNMKNVDDTVHVQKLKKKSDIISANDFKKEKKEMPTIGSWYARILKKAEENKNPDYRFHYSYLIKVMRQYVRAYNGQMAYFDGQSTFELLDGMPFINLDISQLEERFARPLAQQVLLSWIWEKYVKKNSEDKSKASKMKHGCFYHTQKP